MCTKWILALGAALLLGCSSVGGGQQQGHRQHEGGRFGSISVPVHLIKTEDQVRYLVEHYWDDVDLMTAFSEDEEVELKLADYIGLVQSLPDGLERSSLIVPLRKSSAQTLLPLLDLFKTYLYDAGSPLVSDDYFAQVLEWSISSPRLSAEAQTDARRLLERMRLNRIGETATDFVYTKLDGSKHRLISETAPCTLLVFATEGCYSCHDALGSIAANAQLRADVDRGDIGVLVVYVQISREGYEAELPSLPNWVASGYDATGEILDKPLYDIKASPTVYVISRSGKVLAKDLAPERLPSLSVKSFTNND